MWIKKQDYDGLIRQTSELIEELAEIERKKVLKVQDYEIHFKDSTNTAKIGEVLKLRADAFHNDSYMRAEDECEYTFVLKDEFVARARIKDIKYIVVKNK
jgi:hypothetical protein